MRFSNGVAKTDGRWGRGKMQVEPHLNPRGREDVVTLGEFRYSWILLEVCYFWAPFFFETEMLETQNMKFLISTSSAPSRKHHTHKIPVISLPGIIPTLGSIGSRCSGIEEQRRDSRERQKSSLSLTFHFS